jgi:hypothetical protein
MTSRPHKHGTAIRCAHGRTIFAWRAQACPCRSRLIRLLLTRPIELSPDKSSCFAISPRVTASQADMNSWSPRRLPSSGSRPLSTEHL